ncbi:MAG: HAD-IA family hydrolase [Actinomycetota bacterium]|nr:HAD-IA family hydrolase [Actinomycetota bacterium]
MIEKEIEAVFLDVGNTLLMPHPSWEAVTLEVLKKFGYYLSEDCARKGMAAADRYYEERYWKDDSFWASEQDASMMWVELYERALEEMGVDDDGYTIGRAIYDYFGSAERWRTFPDVVPVLEMLKINKKKLALVSNWDSRLANICFEMGIYRYFDSVLSSASVGLVKPDPRIFEAACKRLDVSPKKTIHVGDQYYADILGARIVGIYPVMIDRSCSGSKADVPVVSDLYGLLEILGIEH